MSDAFQQFRDALAGRGIVPPADLLADGSNTRTRDFCQRLLEMGA